MAWSPTLGEASPLAFVAFDLRRGPASSTPVANGRGAFAARGFNAVDDYFLFSGAAARDGTRPASGWRYCRGLACGTRASGVPLFLSTPQVGLLGLRAGPGAGLRVADVRASDPVERWIDLGGADLRPVAVSADPRDRQALRIYAEDARGDWQVFGYHLDERAVRPLGRVLPFPGPASLARVGASVPEELLPSGLDYYFPAP